MFPKVSFLIKIQQSTRIQNQHAKISSFLAYEYGIYRERNTESYDFK